MNKDEEEDDDVHRLFDEKKRQREEELSRLAFDGIGEEGFFFQVQLNCQENKESEVWNHKTFYCLREKQVEERNTNRFWVSWRANDSEASGRVALVLRDRDWKPGEQKYKLKEVERNNEWRTYKIDGGGGEEEGKKKAKQMIDAKDIKIVFRGMKMTLQDMADLIK